MTSQNSRPESVQNLEHRSLSELDGLWKVVHHGNLATAIASEKTPRIAIYFRKLVKQSNPNTADDFESQGAAIHMWVPAAELMRLPLNAVINNSKLALDPCLPLPSEEIDTFDIDISKQKSRLINRYARADESEEFIIPFRHERSPARNSDGGQAYYVALEHNSDPFGIIIPCSEVFRFFYCTSSRMLYTILSDKILDPDRFIIDPTRSGIPETNSEIAVVWLRQWMLNSDRRHIARLFFTPGAFEEAKKVFLRAGGYIDEGSFKSALVALPPFHGPMQLKCIYKKIVSDGRERIFVTRLISALNWVLPFKEIHFGRDNDNRKIITGKDREELPDDERPQRAKVLDEGAEINVLENIPGDDSIAPLELTDGEFEARFPGLDKIYSPQVEKTNQETKNNKGKKVIPLADGTTVEGSSTADTELVNTILRTAEHVDNLRQKENETDDCLSTPMQELEFAGQTKLHERIRDLELARNNKRFIGRLTIDYLSILNRSVLISGKLINILPNNIDGKASKWLFLDDHNQHPRPVLVARITLDQRVRYMIDFMHKEGKRDTASLLLWLPDETSAKEFLLQFAIRACMRNGSINLKNEALLRDFNGNSIKHSFSQTNLATHDVQLIEKIFLSEDNFKKWGRI